MTTVEVRDKLSRRFPRLTFVVSEAAWRHGGVCNEVYVEYTISVQPGFNGCESQNFSDNSLEKCLTKFNAVAGT